MSRKIVSPIDAVKIVEEKTTELLREHVVPKILSENEKKKVPVPIQPITCLNCGKVHQSRYCPECGQASNIKRFNWKGLFENITKGLLNTDKGFLYTIKMLFFRPGRAIEDYIAGKRVKFFPPFPSMFIIAAFYAVVDRIHSLVQKPVADPEAIQAAKDSANEALSNELLANEEIANHLTINLGNSGDRVVTLESLFNDNPYLKFVIETFEDNLGFTILVFIPILVISLRWCFGKSFRKKYNWAETFIMSGFMNTQFFLVLALLMLIEIFFPGMGEKSSGVAVICFVGFLAWDMYPLAGFRKKRKAVWRSVLTFLLFFLISLIIIVVLMVFIVSAFGLSALEI